jgi:hypothetical protein
VGTRLGRRFQHLQQQRIALSVVVLIGHSVVQGEGLMVRAIGPDGKLPVPGYALDTPEATLLEEYTLLVAELESALDTLKALNNLLYPVEELTAENRLVTSALWRDFILRLTGCFDANANPRLAPEDVYGGNTETLEEFRHLEELRHSFIAHHFGAGRVSYVAISTHPHGRAKIDCYWFQFAFYGRDKLPRYGRLIRMALNAARRLHKDQYLLVVKQVLALGSAGVAKLKPVEAIVPRDGLTGRRSAHRRGQTGSAPGPRRSRGRKS